MKRKSVQKITIQELADECGISRYTFYYHFTDIYDCLSWMLQSDIQNCLQLNRDNLIGENLFFLFLQRLREDKSICKHLLNSPRPELLRNFFHQELHPAVRLYLSMTLENDHYQAAESYLSFLTDLITCSLDGMLVNWVQMDLPQSDELIMEYFHTILDGQFESIIHSAEQKGFLTKLDSPPETQPEDRPDKWNHLL